MIYKLIGLKVEEDTVEHDVQYLATAKTDGINSSPADFVSTSLAAMVQVIAAGKSNLVFKLCHGFAVDRPDKSGPLIPINRIPFGILHVKSKLMIVF